MGTVATLSLRQRRSAQIQSVGKIQKWYTNGHRIHNSSRTECPKLMNSEGKIQKRPTSGPVGYITLAA